MRTRVSRTRLRDFHASHGKVLTVTGVHPPGRFGELEYGNDRRVTGFNEKPQVSGGRSGATCSAERALSKKSKARLPSNTERYIATMFVSSSVRMSIHGSKARIT